MATNSKQPVVKEPNLNVPEVRQHVRMALGHPIPQDTREKIVNPGSKKKS